MGSRWPQRLMTFVTARRRWSGPGEAGGSLRLIFGPYYRVGLMLCVALLIILFAAHVL
jgi:hypothetical protein